MLSVCFRIYLTVCLALHPTNQTISWLRSVDNSWIVAITNKLTHRRKMVKRSITQKQRRVTPFTFGFCLSELMYYYFVPFRCFNITVWVHDILNELLKSSTSNYQRDWKKKKKRNHLLNFTVRLINLLSLCNINLMYHFIPRRW